MLSSLLNVELFPSHRIEAMTVIITLTYVHIYSQQAHERKASVPFLYLMPVA